MKKFMYALALIGLVSGVSIAKAAQKATLNSAVAFDGENEDGENEDGENEDGENEDGENE